MLRCFSNFIKFLKGKTLLFTLAGSIVLFCLVSTIDKYFVSNLSNSELYCPGPNAPMDFTNFDNRIGTDNGCFIVPNYLHFVRLNGQQFSYLHMICVLAAFTRQNPDKIYFHYDDVKTFSGKYWETLQNYEGFMDKVELVHQELPTEIFGQQLSDNYKIFHASDIARIRSLIKYGGIFLDNDMYLVKPIHGFRRFEMVLGWDNVYNVLGTQLLIAHKDARFLKLWIESYRGHYKKDEWYYNAGDRPSQEFIAKNPKLVHTVHYMFGNDNWAWQIYTQTWNEWRRYYYALHILDRSKQLILSKEELEKLPEEIDEKNILNYEITLRDMCLDVHNATSIKIV